MIHFDDSFWSIWIISVTKFSLFYLISMILDDFGTFCLLILVHFSSFWWFILVYLLLFLLTLNHFEWFWSIFIHFYDSFWSICFILDNWLISIFDNSIHFGWFRFIFIHLDVFILVHVIHFHSTYVTRFFLFCLIFVNWAFARLFWSKYFSQTGDQGFKSTFLIFSMTSKEQDSA